MNEDDIPVDVEAVVAVVARSALASLHNAYDLLCLLTSARPDLIPALPLVHRAILKLEPHVTPR